MPVQLETSFKNYPQGILEHLTERIKDRNLTKAQADELYCWLRTKPFVPDLTESPHGWYKRFAGFIVPVKVNS